MNVEKRILVTGGAGYIGSHTCKALAQEGYQPVTLDNLSTGNRDAVQWGPLIEADLRDTNSLIGVLEEYQIQAVIHFAACAYVGESVENPDLYYDNNVVGMRSLLHAMKRTGVDRIVFSSSCATYGIPQALPIGEEALQNPINPYGRTKLACEWMIRDFGAAYGLRGAMLRYFNACGADPDGELAERHDPETHLIPLALMAARDGDRPLKVFGTDYPTPDGTCIRDYIHVSDLARAHVLALAALDETQSSIAVNLGTGHGRSILEILDGIEKVTGRSVPIVHAARRPGDPPELVADASAARDILGFTAMRSDLETILRDTAPTFGLEARHG